MDHEVTEQAGRPGSPRLTPTVHLTSAQMREVLGEGDQETWAPLPGANPGAGG